ncbi:hypothetical protein [Nereida ignava]|uniref:hypothetical protein n=1 Tax=Nereida ignava TaxID=282199 RepID=UPI0030FCAF02
MAKSIQAQAAAQIKAKLKNIGVKAQVKSFQAAGCNGVYVYCDQADMAKKDDIDAAAYVHQYGHFNGMEDIYEFSNIDDNIPQVMFVNVSYC